MVVNLQSEIEYFSELQPVDQARLLAVFLHELAVEARTTYGANVDQVHDGARLRFVNEIVCRLAASSSSCWRTIRRGRPMTWSAHAAVTRAPMR